MCGLSRVQVDGLTIGAGFARSTSTGVGLAVATIAEEVPHQLGEFAMLVRTGMSLWRTAFVKLFSSSPALLGFVCGALAGQLSNAEPWIFSLAAGMVRPQLRNRPPASPALPLNPPPNHYSP